MILLRYTFIEKYLSYIGLIRYSLGYKISLIIKNYNAMNHVEISSINKDILFKGRLKDFDLDKMIINSSYRYGNTSDLLIKYFNKSYAKDYSSGHMYIISDMQKNSLEHSFDNDWWEVVFVNSS